MFGMTVGWLDLISLQDMVDGRLLMPHRRKLVMVSLVPRLMKFENEISTAHKTEMLIYTRVVPVNRGLLL